MADKVKGIPSKVTFLKTENKFVLLKRKGQNETRVIDLGEGNSIPTTGLDGRLVKTPDLDLTQTQSYEDFVKPAAVAAEVPAVPAPEANPVVAPVAEVPAVPAPEATPVVAPVAEVPAVPAPEATPAVPAVA